MTCDKCKERVDTEQHIHVVEQCEGCGRRIRVFRPGKHGLGMAITKGDQLGLTESFIRAIQSPTPNPLKNPFRVENAVLSFGWEDAPDHLGAVATLTARQS